jgi:site-specific recombinase XerD
MQGMDSYSQAAMERMMKIQEVLLRAMARKSIQRALSAFEQYHGMVLADKLAAALDPSQKMSVTMALQHPETVQITEADKSRWNLRKQILLKIQEPGGAQTAL